MACKPQRRVRSKICGLTSVADALAAVDAGADAIGLVFYPPSKRAISLTQAQAIVRALPAFVSVVALFVDAKPEAVRQVLSALPLSVLQFHGQESAAYCQQFDFPYIKAVQVRPDLNLLEYANQYPQAQGLLLDAYVAGEAGGTGQRFDWALIPPNLPLPLILSGGLTPENVVDAIAQVRPYAVDVSSGVESAPGQKNVEKMQAFVNGVMHGFL